MASDLDRARDRGPVLHLPQRQSQQLGGPGEPVVTGSRKLDADLATLLAGAYPEPIGASDRVVINPFGMGVHDIALATQIYASALTRNRGVPLTR